MEQNLEKKSIEIGQATLKYLNTTRKWTMFLAIIGFIFLGLVVVFVLIAGTFLSVFKSEDIGSGILQTWLFFPVIIMIIIYFFPVLYLFRFSKHTTLAIQNLSQEELHKAFRNLKSYFVYIGVLLLVVLVIYLIAIIITGTSLAFLKGMG